MTTALNNGFVTSITANTPYAIPPGSYRILAKDALTFATTVGGSYNALSGSATEPGALLTAGGFIKCTSDTIVVIKKVGFKKNYAGLVGRSSPISYWRFNEQSGTTFYDSSGVNNLTFGAGTTGAVAGPLGDGSYAITLDGASSPQLTNSVDTWFHATAISFEAWINNPAFAATLEMVICLGAVGHYMNVNSGNLMMSIRTPASQYTNRQVATISANAWHHIATTWETGDYLRLYVDGVEVVGNDSTVRSGDLETSPNIYIGSFAGGSLFWSGSLADVALYLRKLTATEVMQHYGARLVGA